MLDVVALILFVILFPLSLLYVHGCERLKGKRK
ncbi:hypothetical protein BDD14_3877 [Edaphobacter modestus]|jgi:hypothetical protein|uniref:Uncharacterized protein n=1 Tax=Edaphobacter modestus TaxID=388466 RepID=A0A4Q7YYQ7_9BACT|nr:hypothetical protein BDD14_3877 [Edaphobacter modestus]